MRSTLIASKMEEGGAVGVRLRSCNPLLSLIKFCWNTLAFIRGKPSRHCSYEMEWEYVGVTGEERKDSKNESQKPT